jgi:hypothetical protein
VKANENIVGRGEGWGIFVNIIIQGDAFIIVIAQ